MQAGSVKGVPPIGLAGEYCKEVKSFDSKPFKGSFLTQLS